MLRKIEIALARLLFRLPPRTLVWLSGKPPVTVNGAVLNPEVQLLLVAKRIRGGADGLKAKTPELARRRLRQETLRYASLSPPIRSVRDLVVPAPHGNLRARHYSPEERSGPHPLLVYFHGGGFTTGDIDTHDEPCRVLCHHAGVEVLSVEYRLAPEHPFPAAVEDASVAFAWAREHAAELGADPKRVGVGGDSAGGNLAAVVARLAAVNGGPTPAFQYLIYPVTEALGQHESRRLFAQDLLLTADDIAWVDQCYFKADPTTALDPRLSPLKADDLRGLCPAVVITAGFDPLRDEGRAYARALEAAGNDVTHIEIDGLVHGFLHMAGLIGSAHAAVLTIAKALRVLSRAARGASST